MFGIDILAAIVLVAASASVIVVDHRMQHSLARRTLHNGHPCRNLADDTV